MQDYGLPEDGLVVGFRSHFGGSGSRFGLEVAHLGSGIYSEISVERPRGSVQRREAKGRCGSAKDANGSKSDSIEESLHICDANTGVIQKVFEASNSPPQKRI